MSPNVTRRTRFVEEQRLAIRLPQVQLPIRQSEWQHLRVLLQRCSRRERSVTGAFWSAISVATSGAFTILGLVVVPAVPEWLMRTAIAATVGAAAAAVILGVLQRVFRSERSASIEDALNFMQECENAFVTTEGEAER